MPQWSLPVISLSPQEHNMPTALYTTTHTTNTIYYIPILHNATMSFSSLPVQCPAMIWSQSISFSFNFTSFFLSTSNNVQVFPYKSLSRKESISIQQYIFEVDQVCTILSRVFPFGASTARCSVPVISFFLGRL